MRAESETIPALQIRHSIDEIPYNRRFLKTLHKGAQTNQIIVCEFIGIHFLQTGDFTVIEREWQAGDTVKLYLPFPLSCQANEHTLAIVRGPLVYAYFQDAQADPAKFHWCRGLYPEDAVLSVDPERLEESVQEEPAPDGLLGPVLRVPGFVRSRAPVFATPGGNTSLPGRQEQSLLLHPFADQGAIRGVYRVFMDYAAVD